MDGNIRVRKDGTPSREPASHGMQRVSKTASKGIRAVRVARWTLGRALTVVGPLGNIGIQIIVTKAVLVPVGVLCLLCGSL